MKIFHSKDGSQDADFQKWQDENPNGFFISKGKKGLMIHRPNCPSFDYDDPKPPLTKNEKRCSTDRKELEEYAETRKPLAFVVCTRCPRKQKL